MTISRRWQYLKLAIGELNEMVAAIGQLQVLRFGPKTLQSDQVSQDVSIVADNPGTVLML